MSETGVTQAEDRLARFWREDGLADHDGAFALAVAHGLARRRLRWNLIRLGGVMAVAAVMLWAMTPWLIGLAGRFADRMALLGPAAVVLVVVISVLVITGLPAALLAGADDALGDRPPA
jgi:RsiW-degrading membrane proteinase PrsW (M82 family)